MAMSSFMWLGDLVLEWPMGGYICVPMGGYVWLWVPIYV